MALTWKLKDKFPPFLPCGTQGFNLGCWAASCLHLIISYILWIKNYVSALNIQEIKLVGGGGQVYGASCLNPSTREAQAETS